VQIDAHIIFLMETTNAIRHRAAAQFVRLINTDFFRALCEPVRVQILAVLVECGRTDISSLANRFPQDRSVISRHLALLESCGIVRRNQVGRHRFYEINGADVVKHLEHLTGQVKRVIARCGCT
jgi:DNA-binding transcriptional ArsR family regulator